MFGKLIKYCIYIYIERERERERESFELLLLSFIVFSWQELGLLKTFMKNYRAQCILIADELFKFFILNWESCHSKLCYFILWVVWWWCFNYWHLPVRKKRETINQTKTKQPEIKSLLSPAK